MLTFILAMAASLAADYEYEIDREVPLNSPSNYVTFVDNLGLVTTPASLPDTVIQSSWAPLKCVVEDNHITLRMGGNASTWPTSLPTSGKATCSGTHNSKSYQLTINLTQGPNLPWGDPFVSWTTGFSFTIPDGMGKTGIQLLPSGFTYVDSVHRGDNTGGNDWGGVWCKVKKDTELTNRWWLEVSVWDGVQAGSGHCDVERTGTTDIEVPVSVTVQ